eukprot:CAMPEP_0114635926 /NCGR_PEP_ID=MMETSP0168-20121206/16728_1 /TAXON_ID=95228 ORGANISM="Vannella sp., Strain DIVA3 517/6/12" /NCGR_SAMPLE_ID=MMETSP0168 /ASSEMBLY_ACC=CAM_ASM_000044 /LENGTH=136 /DNA_ID=CAMNT_0001847635 /DNA_START=45 /DNA_END=455 /DNA_ORIENTATION=-
MADNCLFCKIVAGTIPSCKLYEDDKVLSFLDLNPVNPGHALVIPKAHSADLNETSAEDAAAVIAAVKKVAPKILEATGHTAYNVMSNVGGDAGQIIFHTHFHIVPRKPGDGHRHWPQGKYGEGEMVALAEKIQALL